MIAFTHATLHVISFGAASSWLYPRVIFSLFECLGLMVSVSSCPFLSFHHGCLFPLSWHSILFIESATRGHIVVHLHHYFIIKMIRFRCRIVLWLSTLCIHSWKISWGWLVFWSEFHIWCLSLLESLLRWSRNLGQRIRQLYKSRQKENKK